MQLSRQACRMPVVLSSTRTCFIPLRLVTPSRTAVVINERVKARDGEEERVKYDGGESSRGLTGASRTTPCAISGNAPA